MSLNSIIKRILAYTGSRLFGLAEKIPPDSVKIINFSKTFVKCRIDNIIFELDPDHYIDNILLKRGIFEDNSIIWLKGFLKPGMTVIDVGANFGYYTLLSSKIVGSNGHVYAFEPSDHFRERLLKHLQINKYNNTTVIHQGLSNRVHSAILLEGIDTATIHWADARYDKPKRQTNIDLTTLDKFVMDNKIQSIDFIKVDIDGHEPFFLEGASKTLTNSRPVILMEFAHLFLMKSGSGVQELAKQLMELNYILFSEVTGKPYVDESVFLVETMNCQFSRNVICYPSEYPNLPSCLF